MVVLAGCGSGSISLPPVVEPAVAAIPGVRATTHPDPVYGGRYYLLRGGPERSAGPPMLLVHGLGENGVRDWYPVFESLARERAVAAVDLPGFGRSRRANLHYTPEGYARFVAHVIGSRLGGQVDLVGHSMGASIALATAALAPGAVRRLVLIDAAGILSREALVSEYASGQGEEEPTLAAELFQDLFITKLSRLAPEPATLLESERLRSRWLSGDPVRISALSLLETNFDPFLARVVAPTLLLWGESDGVAPLRVCRILAQRLPAVEPRLLPSVGHNPIAERPAAVAEAITEFLGRAFSLPHSRVRPWLSLPPVAAHGSAPFVCEAGSGVRLTGSLGLVRVSECRDLVIEDATVERLVVEGSKLALSGVRVLHGATLTGSRVVVTASELRGEPGLELDGSVLDIASTRVFGITNRLQGNGGSAAQGSRLVFSVSHSRGPTGDTPLHGIYTLESGERL